MNSRSNQVGGDHYINMGIQPWDAMKAWMTLEEYRGYMRGNAIKYLSRAGTKGLAEEDLRKAQHYLTALLETYDSEESRPGRVIPT